MNDEKSNLYHTLLGISESKQLESRNEALKKTRIENLYNALFLLESSDEVHACFKTIPRGNLKCLKTIIEEILTPEAP